MTSRVMQVVQSQAAKSSLELLMLLLAAIAEVATGHLGKASKADRTMSTFLRTVSAVLYQANGQVSGARSNPSIERTCLKPLRAFSPAANVER